MINKDQRSLDVLMNANYGYGGLGSDKLYGSDGNDELWGDDEDPMPFGSVVATDPGPIDPEDLAGG